MLCGQGLCTGPVSARLRKVQGSIPVFVKRAVNRWEFRGQFRVAESLTSGARFYRLISGSGRSTASVSCIVLLERCE